MGPEQGWDVKGTFENSLGRDARVISAYGHTHEQKCDGYDDYGQCSVLMTGSGGGCCENDLPGNHAGFTAVHLQNDGGHTVDFESAGVRLPQGACGWNLEHYYTW